MNAETDLQGSPVITPMTLAEVRMRLATAKLDLKKTPSYGNAVTVQRLARDFNSLVDDKREFIKFINTNDIPTVEEE